MTVMELLRLRVREGRLRKRWSQNELSFRSGVPQPTIWRLENGRSKKIDVVLVRRLARALDVDVDYLVGTREPDVERLPAGVAMVGAWHHAGSTRLLVEHT
jgi:transcriptional regulator with XRE-family HTH domain